MKTIFLLRHAKASWPENNDNDFDRPLTDEGYSEASAVGDLLKKVGYTIDSVISSTALRARQSTELVLNTAKFDSSVISWNKELYFGGLSDYKNALNALDEKISRVLLIGHNPSIESFSSLLSGLNDGGFRMTEATMVCLETFANDWTAVDKGTCQLKWMVTPEILSKMKPVKNKLK